MRLSTEADRDDVRAVAVLQAAVDAGVTFLDTANAYGWSNDDRGHNERLIARTLASWTGDRSSIMVATKGGMTRPNGRWVPDGRAKQLIAGAESSCRALAVNSLDLYQLHAPDPRIPFATSVRALAELKSRGVIRRIGLCNVTVNQIEEARRIAEIDAITSWTRCRFDPLRRQHAAERMTSADARSARNWLPTRPVLAFIMLAFGISYLLGIPWLVLASGATPPHLEHARLYVPRLLIVYGPAFAALMMARVLAQASARLWPHSFPRGATWRPRHASCASARWYRPPACCQWA
jgi:hypothetical protein